MSTSPVSTSRARRMLDKLRRRTRSRNGFWRGHLLSFAAINGFLAFLNFVTPNPEPWSLYVLGATAIPLSIHAIIRRRREGLRRKLEAWIGRSGSDELPDSVYRPLRRMHRSTSAYVTFGVAAGSISGYLFLINVLSGGSFWSIIPAASLALPVILGGIVHQGRRRRLLEELDNAQGDGTLPATDHTASAHPAVRDATAIRERIRDQIDQTVPSQQELLSHVDDIVSEIERMAKLEHGFAEASRIVSVNELQTERSTLAERAGALPTDSGADLVRREYETSLAQADRQIADLRALAERHEILEMRLRNGVSSLRQVSLDLVRLQGEQALSEIDAQLTARADELSKYLSDLQESYRELSSEID